MFKLVRVWAIVLTTIFLIDSVVLSQSSELVYYQSMLVWSPQSDKLAITDGKVIEIYTSQLELLDRFYPYQDEAFLSSNIYTFDLAWSPTSKYLSLIVSGSTIPTIGSLQIWEIATGIKVFDLEKIMPESGIAWDQSDDHFWVVASLGNHHYEIRNYDLLGGVIRDTIRPVPQGAQFGRLELSKNGILAVQAMYDMWGQEHAPEPGLQLWDVTKTPATYKATLIPPVALTYTFHPTSDLLAVVKADVPHVVEIWNTATNPEIVYHLNAHNGTIFSLIWRTTGLLTEVSSANDKVYIWDVSNMQPTRMFELNWTANDDWSPDGAKFVIQDHHEEPMILDATTGAVLARLDAADLPEMP